MREANSGLYLSDSSQSSWKSAFSDFCRSSTGACVGVWARAEGTKSSAATTRAEASIFRNRALLGGKSPLVECSRMLRVWPPRPNAGLTGLPHRDQARAPNGRIQNGGKDDRNPVRGNVAKR